MKAIIYTRVSTGKQTTTRQVNDLKAVTGFEVVKVYKETISGFTKAIGDRKELQKALKYMADNGIKCIMVHEVSRLGRNTHEVLNLIKELEDQGIQIYIHNLGKSLSKDDIYSKLIVTIMADLARLESEQLSLRIKSGIRARKKAGLTTGRQVGSKESLDKFMNKHKGIQKFLKMGWSYSQIQRQCGCSMSTIKKVKDNMPQPSIITPSKPL